MATVKEIKATARPKAGKGAARSERRAGRVPGVIYGDSKPPVTISLDYADLRQKIDIALRQKLGLSASAKAAAAEGGPVAAAQTA